MKFIAGESSLFGRPRGCMSRSTSFYFDGSYYGRTDGAAMGSHLSPVASKNDI